MRRFLPTLALLAATFAHAADGASTLQSPACSAALDRLQAHEERQRNAGRVDDSMRAQLQALRAAAAKQCLGSDGSAASPSQHELRAPITVAPVAPPLLPRAAVVAPPVVVTAPPPRPLQPPLTLLSCDPAGCTASDGSRFTRAGPVLVGPRGACQAAGPPLNCP